jgi:hypothetical protein
MLRMFAVTASWLRCVACAARTGQERMFRVADDPIMLRTVRLQPAAPTMCGKMITGQMAAIALASMMATQTCRGQSDPRPYVPSDRFKDIDQERTIIVNGKNLTLKPFEVFDIMTFEGVSHGMSDYMTFIRDSNDDLIDFSSSENTFTYSNDSIEEEIKEVTIKLELEENNYLIRKAIKNRQYKIIYAYKSASKVHRNRPEGIDYQEGYYIVDILDISGIFEREKDSEY